MTKIITSVTISVETYEKFNDFCKKNGFKKSPLIENLIKKYLLDQGA